MISPRETIAAKRDGHALEEHDIAAFVEGLASGAIGDGQAAAFAMAVFLNGMDAAECVALTRAMARSGRTMRWDGLPGPVLDKHSTGGIGDTVSLILAPAIAACGGFVPMIAGRGLGHTGGTIDKLEAIPGYDTAPSHETFARTVREAGAAIIGQTADLAPADRRLYAVRDVTATVESIPLITASILAKKLAAGLGSLVLDVKVGSGAFMATREQADALARSLVSVANGAGLKASALITDMDQPLAPNAGNALEIRLAIDILAGRAEAPRLMEATLALGAEMLRLAGIEPDEAAARTRLARAFANGAAAERFARMVAALAGPADIVERPHAHFAAAPYVVAVPPPRRGTVQAVDTRALGLAVVALGGGREAAGDRIDPRVGLSDMAGLGEPVGPDRPLALVHAASEDAAEAAAVILRAAYRIGDAPPAARPVVLDRIDGGTAENRL